MKLGTYLLAVGLLLVGACGSPTREPAATQNETRGPNAPSPASKKGCAKAQGTAVIEWVNFVKLDGITYIGAEHDAGRPLTDDDLRSKIGEVLCTVSETVSDPSYEIVDGDSGFLPAGTPLLEIQGYDPSFRLAAVTGDGVMLFEADHSPGAEVGEDLLDIRGHVDYIGINSHRDGITEMAAIHDPAVVERLIEMVLEAPVNQARNFSNGDWKTQVFVAFHLEDGTTATRAFGFESNLLSRGILVPEGFGDALETALGR
jgi:hypothetical protein